MRVLERHVRPYLADTRNLFGKSGAAVSQLLVARQRRLTPGLVAKDWSSRSAMTSRSGSRRSVQRAYSCSTYGRTIVRYSVFTTDCTVKYYDVPKNEQDIRCKIREYFYKNACVTDVRIIDILVIKGYMELKEITHTWAQKGHIMAHFHPTAEPKPCDFIGKFLAGED